jgi:hypothetical protein
VVHPACMEVQAKVLALCRDIPLYGFGWDEPCKGGGLVGSYKAGTGFMAFFKEYEWL